MKLSFSADAFGSPMSSRSFNASSSRYGFNGKEKDDEKNVAGGSYDFGARIYDSRLGKWYALDPLAQNYRSFSPYNFAGNNPIICIDPDGKKIVVVVEGKEYRIGPFNLFKPKLVKQAYTALKYAHDGEIQAQHNVINELKKDRKNVIRISVTDGITQTPTKTEIKDGKTYHDVEWNPNKQISLFDYDSNNNPHPTGESYSSALALYHELVHKWHKIFEPKQYEERKKGGNDPNDVFDNPEEKKTIKTVNAVAEKLGEPQAKNHYGVNEISNGGDVTKHESGKINKEFNEAVDKDFSKGGIFYEEPKQKNK